MSLLIETHDIVKSLVHIPSTDMLLIVGVEVPENNILIHGMDYKCHDIHNL